MGKKASKVSAPMGKKAENVAKIGKKKRTGVINNPGRIQNRMKRAEMYGKYLAQKKSQRRQRRLSQERQAQELGAIAAAPKQTPRTLDNTRHVDATMVLGEDEEVQADQVEDEFSPYFEKEARPKILVTTRPKPSRKLFWFMANLMSMIPRMYYYPRRHYSVKDICAYARNRKFTHLMILSEKSKVCNGMILSHLRPSPAATGFGKRKDDDGDGDEHAAMSDDDDDDDEEEEAEWGANLLAGPTAFFKVSNVILTQDIPHHGRSTAHVPELVLNGFGTRLGHRVGRFLASLFPHNCQFKGRQVATFHNQRDYIFVRHHRYMFYESKDKSKATAARLQDLGPRFTLKLKWLQEGTFDSHFGEYEWHHKRKEMDTTRRTFHL